MNQEPLGVQWNANRDELQFNIGDVISTMEEMEPTKRDVASRRLACCHIFQDVLSTTIQGKDWLGRPSDRKSAREVETAPLNYEGI